MRLLLILPLLILTVGCNAEESAQTITLATTTSTRDSGLLDVLMPMFESRTGIQVKVVAVGSGQALEMGRRGDADLLLTHAPEAEQKFVAEGYGLARQLVFSNDFVLVGPNSDPAEVRQEKSIPAAFAQLARSQSPFVSRGDESGTHWKEQKIWAETGVHPQGEWFLQAGAGMVQTLRMASEKGAYTLSDWGTFLAHRDDLNLEILFEGDPMLRNQYAVIVINPKRHPHMQSDAAQQFADFLLASKTQSKVAEFGIEKFGEPLFFPQKNSNESAPQGNAR